MQRERTSRTFAAMRKSFRSKERKCRYSIAMLIDDSEMDNFINQKILEIHCFADRVYTNTNGLSALEFLQNLTVNETTLEQMVPEVIFVDLNMPVMNGFQFLRKFYELPKEIVDKSKVAILTSSIDDRDRQQVHEINPAVIFINKPLSEEALAAIV
jgi:CheY-like chemotaxis protein